MLLHSRKGHVNLMLHNRRLKVYDIVLFFTAKHFAILFLFFIWQKVRIFEFTVIETVFFIALLMDCVLLQMVNLGIEFLLVLLDVFLKEFARHESSENFLNFGGSFIFNHGFLPISCPNFFEESLIVAVDIKLFSERSMSIFDGFPIIWKLNFTVSVTTSHPNRYPFIYLGRFNFDSRRMAFHFLSFVEFLRSIMT